MGRCPIKNCKNDDNCSESDFDSCELYNEFELGVLLCSGNNADLILNNNKLLKQGKI